MERLNAIEEQERWALYSVGKSAYDREFARIYFNYQRWTPPPSLANAPWIPKAQAIFFILISVVILEATTAFGDAGGRYVAAVACGAATYRLVRLPLYYWTSIRVHGIGFLKRIFPLMQVMFQIKAWHPHWYYRSPFISLLVFVTLGTAPFLMYPSMSVSCTVVVATFLLVFTIYVEAALPPTVLVLTSTKPRKIDWVQGISFRCHPMRVMSLLDPDAISSLGLAYNSLKETTLMRTRIGDWRDTVQKLLDIVPIVIVDAREPVEDAVRAEAEMIKPRATHRKKSIFVGDSVGNYPVLRNQSLALNSPLLQLEEEDLDSYLFAVTTPQFRVAADELARPAQEEIIPLMSRNSLGDLIDVSEYAVSFLAAEQSNQLTIFWASVNQDAIQNILVAAFQGNRDAMTLLGRACAVKQSPIRFDKNTAEYWLEKAWDASVSEETGPLSTDHLLFFVLLFEMGCQTFEVDLIRMAAEKGYSPAMLLLGHIHKEGSLQWRVQPDANIAYQWFQRAAKAGHPEGNYDVACCFRNGKGVEADHRAYLKHLQLAAIGGCSVAQMEFGIILLKGDGTKQDKLAGVKLCKQGNDRYLIREVLSMSPVHQTIVASISIAAIGIICIHWLRMASSWSAILNVLSALVPSQILAFCYIYRLTKPYARWKV